MDHLPLLSLTPRTLPSALLPYNVKHPLDYISNVTAHAQVRITSIEAIGVDMSPEWRIIAFLRFYPQKKSPKEEIQGGPETIP
ncbi:hypothetical protein LOAG_09414 [Loa loa]|uniref:Uncharacterized protein n=1 Tax=Loa loa TaxID=7209 RepID=A0A1S0TRZ2_LOALO|nr:hypothetical protein LOAG_09414 [Loa loa]EFO19083.1 hypothetical protein LOAG_09414 [Loa loa]